MQWLILPVFLFSIFPSALTAQTYSPTKTRILFVLDGSGSMKENFGGESRWKVAKELLSQMVDSIERNNKNIEFGLRVFGHQSPDAAKDCKDSKLELPFAPNNSAAIKSQLNIIDPKGNTPIAYSLYEAARDFPDDPGVKNAIVLITDGLESCEGDPCAVSGLLQEKRISLRPFVIGMGLPDSLQGFFDCVGTYYDASNRQDFRQVLKIVVSQALNTTTVQVNLLNLYGKPTETDVEMTFYDHFSGAVRYNFVHAIPAPDLPDTLYLDPVGKYDVTVHSTPSVTKTGIELTPGKHNVIAVDVPQGELQLNLEGQIGFSDIQALVREANSPDILFVQDLNTTKKYLVGEYDLEILTLPRIIHRGVEIGQRSTKTITVPKAGMLSLVPSERGILSIYVDRDDKLERVYEIENIKSKETISLQPGIYQIIFRPHTDKKSVLTRTKTIEVTPGCFINHQL